MANIQSAVKDLIVYKHDFLTFLTGTIELPLFKMEQGGTDDYFALKDLEKIKSLVKLVMTFFRDKWVNEGDPEDLQIQSMQEYHKHIGNKEEQIKKIIKFYTSVIRNNSNFLDNGDGKDAFEVMNDAILAEGEVLKELSELIKLLEVSLPKDNTEPVKRAQAKAKKAIQECNLLSLLQAELDKISADIIYIDEVMCIPLNIKIDSKKFIRHVMVNIRENIDKHAFPIDEFAHVRTWEKQIRVRIIENQENYVISIENNGKPFEGDINLIMQAGQYFGKTGHSGFGLYSANETLKSMGGKLEFKVSDSKFPVSYILTLKK